VWYFGIVPTVWYFGIVPTVWYFFHHFIVLYFVYNLVFLMTLSILHIIITNFIKIHKLYFYSNLVKTRNVKVFQERKKDTRVNFLY